MVAHKTLAMQQSPVFCWAVRAGFIARGITYGLIGGIAFALAAGAGARDTGAAPNQQGALQLIAQAPLGRLVLTVAAIGLIAYALWKLTQGVIGVGPEGGGDRQWHMRVANLSGGLVYLAFSALAIEVVLGAAGNQTVQQQATAHGISNWPGGKILIALAGVVLIAISLQQAYTGARGDFIDDSKLTDMGEHELNVFHVFGRVGLIARALVFALSGWFLVRTAISWSAAKGLGIDGALAEVHHQPYGNWMLSFVAIGLLIFAAFSFQEARRRRL